MMMILLRQNSSCRLLWLLFGILLSCAKNTHAYATPELNRRNMAGLWRLTSPKSVLVPLLEAAQQTAGGAPPVPMKEFTVYPKKYKELLVMLKEDGSFQQYNQDSSSNKKIRGTWDYIDGKLILAADRPDTAQRDTILVGKVVATSHTSLVDNPLVPHAEQALANQTTTTAAMDTHLSVPKGSVKVGKFFYPKNHPSFFEQPIFSPTPTGSFQLKQVLGSLNTQQSLEDEAELFSRQDFYDKRFFLTSHAIEYKPRGRLRWSIKYNKFVEDAPKKKKPETNASIRVMEVQFHANHTFSTVAGLGSAAILRGKWDVIGRRKDQLWLQVWRFGFGRSVSGSVYSEGKGLSHDDAKTYWGEISHVQDSDNVDDEQESSDDVSSPEDHKKDEDPPRLLQVIGSVLYGSGLEPQPVARFIMRESTDMELYNDDDEDDDDEDTTEADLERSFQQQKDEEPEDDIDWSNAFQ